MLWQTLKFAELNQPLEDDDMPGMITSRQRDGLVNTMVAAARKAIEESIDELVRKGKLHSDNQQRVQAQGNKLGKAIKATINRKLPELTEDVVGILRNVPVFNGETVVVRETTGTRTLAEALYVFPFQFNLSGARVRRSPSKPTAKMPLAVYCLNDAGNYRMVFGGFGENLRRLCWTEEQIIVICEDHHDIIHRAKAPVKFLFEGEDSTEEAPVFWVASVQKTKNAELCLHISPLGNPSVFDEDYSPWFVVPKLAA